jgi:hypothetical protein
VSPQAPIPSAAIDRENPWPGLASFTEDARAFFFGREKETDELVRLVRRNTLTVLFGQSGLGKSSLLQAGAFPLLREADFLPLYLRLDHSVDVGAAAPSPRSADPIAAGAPRLQPSLADQVKAALVAAFQSVGADAPAPRPDESLWEYFHRKDIDIWSAKNRLLTPILAFDQFEEIFTLGRATDAQRERGRAFLAELADLVENRPPAALREKFDAGELDPARYAFDKPSCQVILSLREDFLPDLEGLKNEMRSIMQSRMRVRRLNGTQALEIVTRPAPHLLAEGVAERIVEFVAGARGGSAERLAELEVEPALLSVICRELNERRRTLGQPQISADLVSGNRREILTDFYERSVADLPEAMRAFVEDHLLTKSGFRDNLALETALEFPGVTRPLIDTLVARRLVRLEDRLGVQRVELTHDVLAEVIRAARDKRQERELLEAEERRRRDAEKDLARTRQSLWRARAIAVGGIALAVVAAASAVFGFVNLRRAREAEAVAVKAAVAAREAEKTQARLREQAEANRRTTAVALEEAEGVLGFNLIELGEQLGDYGQMPLMRQVAAKSVAYYEALPAELHSPSMRAGYARALCSLASVLSVQGDISASANRYEQALKIFAEIERTGALTNAMRPDYGGALTGLAWNASIERRFQRAIPLAEQAEAVLRPAVNDPKAGGLVQRQLSSALTARGFALLRGGGGAAAATQALAVLQEAVAAMEEADRRPPLPARPGLHAGFASWLLGEALGRLNRRGEAVALRESMSKRMREFIAKDPYLAAAKSTLALCDQAALDDIVRNWNFEQFLPVQEELTRLREDLLKLDPHNWPLKNDSMINWASDRFGFEFRRGNFAAAEAASRKGLELLTEGSESLFLLGNAANAQFNLAEFYAATGRDADADRELAIAAKYREMSERELSDATQKALAQASRSGQRRVASARLNWNGVRQQAEATLASLAQLQVSDADQANLRNRRSEAQRDLMWAAFHLSDYAAARSALDQSGFRADPAPRESDSTQDRFTNAGRQLTRVHVLYRAGEIDEAHRVLAALWPEVEVVFAAAPRELFNQVQMARALSIKAEVEIMDDASRRALLERAADYLRPAAAAGKLARYEREVLLAGVETALAGRAPIGAPAGSGTPSATTVPKL